MDEKVIRSLIIDPKYNYSLETIGWGSEEAIAEFKEWIHFWRIKKAYSEGNYEIRTGTPPDDYNFYYSEMCWGWLKSGRRDRPVVVTFADGERGSEVFDSSNHGLIIWYQGSKKALDVLWMHKASQALLSKRISPGEFISIIKMIIEDEEDKK